MTTIVDGNLGIFTTGNVTANNFFGNIAGNALSVPGANTQVLFNDNGVLGAATGLTYNKVDDVVGVSGDLVPAANGTGSLGNASFQWKDMWISGNTIYMENIPLTMAGASNLQVNGSNVLTVTPSGLLSAASITVGTLTANNAAINNDASVGGNLTVAGDITATGNINIISGNSAQFFGNIITGANALYAGIPVGFAAVQESVLQLASNFDGYTQLNAQNLNTGSQASFDYVATADNGNDVFRYIDMGIASSTWDGTAPESLGNAVSPNDGYLYVDGGNLVVGTNTPGKVLKINVGAPDNTGAVAQFNLPNTLSTSATTGALTVVGGIGATSNITAGGNITAGNITTIGNITAGNIIGTIIGAVSNSNYSSYSGDVVNAAQPNITSLGTLTSLGVSGNVTAGNVSATDVTGTTLGGSLTTAAQPNITSLGVLSSLSVTGNSSAGNVNTTGVINAGSLGGLAATGVGATGSWGISVTGSASTVTTAAQPNITSVGTLTSLAVTGNVTAGNLTATTFTGNFVGNFAAPGSNTQVVFNDGGTSNASAGMTFDKSSNLFSVAGNIAGANLTTVGNVTGAYIIGDGGLLSNITGANVTGVVANANYAAYAGNITIANQPNITSLGTLTALTVTGNVEAGNVYANSGTIGAAALTATSVTATTLGGSLTTAAQPNVTSLGTLTSLDVGGNITAGNVTATTITGNLVGNVTGNISGNLSAPGANTQVIFNDAGTANASTGMTFDKTSSALTVVGNVSVGNLTTIGNVTGAHIIGDGGSLSNITGANVTGVVANANYAAYAGNITIADQPNITGLGTLSSLSVTGNVTAGNMYANAGTIGAATLTATTVTSTTIGGSLTTAAQPNVTSLGTLTSLDVTGNVSGGNITTGAQVVATGNITGGNLVTGGVVSATGNIIGANVTSNGLTQTNTLNVTTDANVGNIGSSGVAIVTGNITGGNINTAGQVVATANVSGANIVTAGNVYAATGLIANAITGNAGGVTITATGTNQNVTLAPSGTGVVSASSARITNVATPTADTDASNKAYVDSVAQGLSVKTSCIVATTASLPAYSYNNGASGVGATATALSNGVLVVDGYTTQLGDRILVKNELGGLGVVNGIYVVTTAGAAGATFVLTRSVDFDAPGEIPSAFTFIAQGTVNADTGWVCTTNPPVVVGTTTISFSQFSGAGAYSAGSGLTLTGGVFSANVDGTTTAIVSGNIAIPTGAILTNPNITAATGTSIVLTGNASASNVNATLAVVASTLVSNVTTGTAPLTVTSTTRVANLNVSHANVSDFGAITTQTTGVFFPTFVSSSSTGNLALASNTALSFNAATGALSSTLLGGTLTTAAQPNVTSVGTLTSLNVTGNAISGNVYANSGTVGATTLVGSLATAAQPNITSVGTLTNLAVTSNISVGNVNAGNFVGATFLQGVLTGGSAAQPNITSIGTLATLTVSGNAAVGNLSTLGQLTAVGNLAGGNISTGGIIVATGNISGANLNSAGIVSAGGNVVSGANVNTVNLNTTGNIVVGGNAAITGTAAVTGNLSGANITSGNLVVAAGNIQSTGGYIIGDGGFLSNLTVSGGTAIVNGTSNVSIPTSGGNINFNIGGTAAGKLTATSVSLGVGAGAAGTFATAIGSGAGGVTQGSQATAIGYNAGASGQGAGAVAIGALAGQTNQTAGSIAINASGSALNPTGAGLFINPVRSDSGNVTSPMFYNSSTNELTYSTAMSLSGNVVAGNVYANSGTIGASILTGTLSTASQPNITSVGTLTSLAVTGNVTTGNVSGTTGAFTDVSGNGSSLTALNASNVTTGTLSQARLANASVTLGSTALTLGSTVTTVAGLTSVSSTTFVGALTGAATSATTAGTVTTAAQPNITSVGTLTSLNVSGALTTTQITAGASGTAGSITGNWTLTGGSRLEATYADMAERYTSDEKYPAGTVLMIGGTAETTIATVAGKTRIAGIVSSEPAYVLNSTLKDSVVIALIGRVPCRVVGTIEKGDLLTISDIPGVATVAVNPQCGTIIARALESYNSTEVGMIEVKVDKG